MKNNELITNSTKKTEIGNLKSHEIDNLHINFHLALLGTPLILFSLSWLFFSPNLNNDSLLKLLLICIIYIFGYSLTYYLHQGRVNRLWQHLQQVVHINEMTFELVNLSSKYKDEQAFLTAL